MNRSCLECHVRLPLTLASRAKFCSAACKQRAYRRRSRRGLPAEMTARPRWVRHDAAKMPMTLFGGPASVVDSRTWTTYEKAAASSVGTGLGIVLGDGLGCLDLDHCIEGGRLAPWAAEVLDEWRDRAVFIEVSMSGTGLHLFVPMAEGPGRRIRDGERNIEIYSRARYIAVTGRRWQ